MTRRRGSIQHRSGRWEARLALHGRRLWLGRHDTEEQAQEAIDRALADKGPLSDETVAQFCDRWVSDYPRHRATTNHVNRYAAKRIKEITEPRISHLPMRSVTRSQARAFVLAFPYLRDFLRAMYYDAISDELVKGNPFANLRLPSPRGRADLVPLTEEEVGQLAAAADRFGYGALILVAAGTGMRTGELFELRWEDIDFRSGTIHIRRRMKSEKGGTIVLPDLARAAIESLPRPREGGLVFRTRRGRKLTSSNFRPYWYPIRELFEAQLPPARAQELREARMDKGSLVLYELRHAFASHMLNRGASPLDVAIQLGHKGTELVEKLYGHPDQELARERLRRAMGENVAELREVSNG
jgi:integrase